MAYEIIAVDIDGTLTNDDKIITPRTKKALLEVQKAGKKVVIASGRHPYGVIPYAKELELQKYGGYLLCFNGGRVVRASDKGFETIYSKNLDLNFVPQVCDLLKDSNITVNTYQGDTIVADQKTNAYSHVEPDILKMPFQQVDDFVRYVDFPINKLLLAGEPEELDRHEKVLASYFDGVLDVFKSAPFFLEVVPLGVSKGASLHPLLETLGLQRENLIACGDSYNDITMLGYAGLGVAMENAEEDVKTVADYITKSNNEDGIGFVAEKFMLSDEKIGGNK